MAYFNFYSRVYNFQQRTSVAWRLIWHFYPGRFYLFGLVVLQIISWIQARFIWQNFTGNFLILHYNVSLGADLVGPVVQVFRYPILGLGVAAVNLVIASLFYRAKDFKVITNLLFAAALIFNALMIVVLFSIYLTNFRY